MALTTFLGGIGVGVIESFCSKGIEDLWANKNHLSLYRKTLFGKYKNERIRFSISYLFRIKIPATNSYLLVLNRRIPNQLQPVGGVYKKYGDDKLFEDWQYQPDKKSNGLGIDSISDNDLRFFVKGKYTINVIKWFEAGKERECNADREFVEELIETKILNKNIFTKIQYKQIKREATHLKWSDFHKCYEVLIYDIFELLPTLDQKEALVQLSKEEFDLSKGYAIVDCEEIEQSRLIKNAIQVAKIGEHTKLIINEKH
jgi:hypothetical protein